MCGIVGYSGEKLAKPILVNGLLKLEYRGYDSAGISTIESNGISNIKVKGRVKALEDIPEINTLSGTIGIAHTRWATHGKPSTVNSHPHLDNSKSFAVVHNGIIENYAELRKFLTDNEYVFASQTDTEVVPNLIHYYYDTNNYSFLEAVQKACNDLKGSFALEIISSLFPDTMIVVRKDSPLVIGKGNGETYISSDIPALLSFTKDFYLLNDLEYAVIKKGEIEFYNKDLEPIKKDVKTMEWDASSAEKDGYEDYMLKEIHEQPRAVRETVGSHLRKNMPCEFDELNIPHLRDYSQIYIVACGTAMHAGLVAKNLFEKLCHLPTFVDIASEFRYRDPIIGKETLAIFVSQSGETADTIAALKLAKAKGATTIAISNVIGSSITREADYYTYTHAGPEIAVASTKAYTSQIVLLSMIAIFFAERLRTVGNDVLDNIKNEIMQLPEKVTTVIEKNKPQIEKLAKTISKEKDVFFIGRGPDYNVAQEGSLKLKEISYIHSEAYAAGELKHGTIALIENGITVVAIMTDEALMEKTISNIQEVITRGAKTVVVTNLELPNKKYDYIFEIPKTSSLISPVLSVIPLQLLAYYVSKEKGLDVDKPRNLAKSVTVE
ncbi:MAG: glutamine--fructose-6-phosphate transaminase (isomerizing) [Clostridia bacterium]|nr:glutamine--fructose-6-phosphate transaminase (isomerizing) [Clostridia bacterium]